MIEQKIHFVWLGGNVPAEMLHNIYLARRHNPHCEHFLWTEDRLHDDGIGIHQFDQQNITKAGISGGLRLVILEKYGGIYLDGDVECIKPFDDLFKLDAFCGMQDHRTGNAVVGAFAHHPWIRWQLDHAKECHGQDPAWSTHLMDRSPKDGVTIFDSEVFYPWHWDTPKDQRNTTDRTLAVHHWRGQW